MHPATGIVLLLSSPGLRTRAPLGLEMGGGPSASAKRPARSGKKGDSINDRVPPCLKPSGEAPVDEASPVQLAHLLRQIQTGHRPSFDRLYALTKRRLLRCILRIERDTVEAEDLLQEVYLKVWRLSAQFDASKGNVEMWLTGIARHLALDRVRRQNARPKAAPRHEDVDPYETMACAGDTPLENAMREQTTAALQRCLWTLRAAYREVLVLAFWSDLTYEEIARVLGRPLGTIKSWAQRALRELGKRLSEAASVSPTQGRASMAD